MNESTKFISPTKVLEYMAAELPIVSTAITDVVKPYGHIVSIAHSADEFIAACDNALNLTEEARARDIDAMRKLVAATSWSAAARSMHALIEAPVVAKSSVVLAAAGPSAARISPMRINPIVMPGNKMGDSVHAQQSERPQRGG